MNPFAFKSSWFWCFLLLVSYLSTAIAQTHRINKDTGAETWETDTHGVHFALTQILPEQVRAFYVNRGFTLDQIAEYADSCVFMTVLRNDSATKSIHFVRSQWQLLVTDEHDQVQTKRLRSVKDWLDQFIQNKNRVKKPALIAFRWAQFPPEQVYQPGGDWNQGMLSMGLSAKRKFDLIAKWDGNSQTFQAKLEGVQCAQ